MKEITIASQIFVAEKISELDDTDKMLLLRAKEAAKGAYAPYSNFKVGAAVLMENEAVFIGSNQENAAYPSTMCGERNAIFAAAAHYPKVAIQSVAITIISAKGMVNKPVPPCGTCRQVIYENECRHQTDIRIILQGDGGDIYLIQSVKDILPIHFDASFL